MKIVILFLLSALIVEATFADNRLSDIRPGIPCAKIPEIEKRLGSLEIADNDEKAISEFKGTQGGQNVTVIYRCDKGLLIEQKIFFTRASRDEAYLLANEQKKTLSKYLGDPIHDGLDLSIWKKLYFGFLGADLDYLTGIVVWGRADEDAMLSVRESRAGVWEVSISQGSSKLEYILNM